MRKIWSILLIIVFISHFSIKTEANTIITQSQIEGAINWTINQKNDGNLAYTDYCMAFVSDAYKSQGIDIRYNRAIYAANALCKNTDANPPRGALVFWDWWGDIGYGYQQYGHIGISLGNGQVIHADYDGIKITGTYIDSSRTYLGWGIWNGYSLDSITYSDIGDDYYALISSPHYTGLYLTNDNTNVALHKYSGESNQIWHLSRAGDGSYRIKSLYDGKCLEIADVTVSANVQVYEDNGTDAQRWFFKAKDTNYILKSKRCTYTIDIAGYGNDGDNIWIYTENGSYNQQFAVEKVSINSKYLITYNANGGSGGPVKQEKIGGVGLVISDKKPTRSNYTFLGWSKAANSNHIDFLPSDIIYSDESMTLYAVWKSNISSTYTSKNNNNFIIEVNNVENGNLVILALYKDKKFVKLYNEIYQGENIPFTVTEDYDEAKVMVWQNFSTLEPITNVEIVK